MLFYSSQVFGISSCNQLSAGVYELTGDLNVRNFQLGAHAYSQDRTNVVGTLPLGTRVQFVGGAYLDYRGGNKGCFVKINLIDDETFNRGNAQYKETFDKCNQSSTAIECGMYYSFENPFVKRVDDKYIQETLETIDQTNRTLRQDLSGACSDNECSSHNAGNSKPEEELDGNIEIEKKRSSLLHASFQGGLNGCRQHCQNHYSSDSQCEAYCDQIKDCANRCKTSDIVERCKSSGPKHDEACVASDDYKCSPFSATQGVHFGESSRVAVVKNHLTKIMDEVFADEKFASLKKLKGDSSPEYLANYFICYTKVVENSTYEPINRANDKNRLCQYTAFGIGQILRSSFHDVFGLNQGLSRCFNTPIGDSQNCRGSAPQRYRSELLSNKYRGLTPNQLYDLQAFDVDLQLRSMVGIWLNMYEYDREGDFIGAWDRYRGHERGTFALDFLGHTNRKTSGMSRSQKIEAGKSELDECATSGYENYKKRKLK